MTDNSTHTILFELQKNLQDLSSAKIQMEEFRTSALEVIKGVDSLKTSYIDHLEKIESDYKEKTSQISNDLDICLTTNKAENLKSTEKISKGVDNLNTNYLNHLEAIKKDYEERVNNLTTQLNLFLAESNENNEKYIKELTRQTDSSIKKGMEMFELVSNKVEASNDRKIETIKKFLEHYQSVVEASYSLIETLTSIDFPTKLDAISSKSQLINETITSSKQTIEMRIADVQRLIIDNNTNNLKSLVSFINETSLAHNALLLDLVERFKRTHKRLDRQGKELKTLKYMSVGTLVLIIVSVVVNLLLNYTL